MPTKSEVLADPNSCLNKAADDEPIFVLRAQDVTAAKTIRDWAQLLMSLGGSLLKANDALHTAKAMERYHTRKLPD